MCRVWLLTAHKPINRPGWWKGKFALFQTPATARGGGVGGSGGTVGGHVSKGQLLLTGNEWGKSVSRQKEGLRVETARSALTVTFKLVIGALTSHLFFFFQSHLDCFRYG